MSLVKSAVREAMVGD